MKGAFLLQLRPEFKELLTGFKLCKKESIAYFFSKIIPDL